MGAIGGYLGAIGGIIPAFLLLLPVSLFFSLGYIYFAYIYYFMRFNGGADSKLTLPQIDFINKFLSNKPQSFRNAKTLFNALQKPPFYRNFNDLKLSFPDVKLYLELTSNRKMPEYKHKLDPIIYPHPTKPITPKVVAPPPPPPTHVPLPRAPPPRAPPPPPPLPPPPPPKPGRMKQFATFLKKTFKKKSPPPVPHLLVPPPATAAVRAAPPPLGYVAPRASSASSRSSPSFRRHKDSKTRKYRRRGFATLSSDSGERLIKSRSASSSPRTSTSTFTKTASSSSSSPSSPPSKSGSPKVGTRGVDAREVARKLGHKSSESPLSSAERKARDSERLRTGAPAYYAVAKGAKFVKEGTKKIALKGLALGFKGVAALTRKTGQAATYVGRKGPEVYRTTKRKIGEKYREGKIEFNKWTERRAEAKRLEALRKADEPSSRSSHSSRPGMFSRIGAKFRGSKVVPAIVAAPAAAAAAAARPGMGSRGVGIRGPGLARRRISSSSSSASSASRHTLPSRSSSASSSRSSSASSHSGSPPSPRPRPSARTGIAALAHAHGVVSHAPVRTGRFSGFKAKVKGAFTRNPAKAAGIRGPGLLKRSNSAASSRHSSSSSIKAVAPASPKKGFKAWVGNLFSRKKQVTRKVKKSSSHSGVKRGLMAKGSYASSSSRKSSDSNLSSGTASTASNTSTAATASTASNTSTASGSKKSSKSGTSSRTISSSSSSKRTSPKSSNSSWSSSSSSKKPKPKIMVKIKSTGAKGGPAQLPVFFPGPLGFKSKGAVPVAPSPKAKSASASPMMKFDSPSVSSKAASGSKNSSKSGTSSRTISSSSSSKGTSPKSWSAHWSSTGSADSASSASPMMKFDSPLAAAAASPKAASPKAAAVPSPKSSWSSSSGSKKHKPPIKFKIKSPVAKGGPAAFPIVFPGPLGFKYKGAVVSAAAAAKVSSPKASAPMTVVPSSVAATSLPALRKLLADATQMLAVRKAIAVREALAARSARTNKLPSAAEKREEALAARSNFRDVKALVEKLSARVAAASAPMVVKAAPVSLNVSSRNKRSSSSDGSPKKKTKKMKFSIKPLEKGAAPAPIVIVESPKGKSSHSWSRNIGLEDSIKVAVDKLDWEESPKAAAAPAPIVIVESPKGSIKGLSGVKFGKAAKEAKEKGSVFIAPVVSPPSSPKAAPAPMIVVKSPKAASPKAAAAAGRKAQVMLLSEIPDIAEFGKEHLKAFGAAAMGRQTLRKKTNLLEGLDLAKQPEKKGNKTRRLERYERLLREGRITEARRYMKRRNMLNEVMANLVPLENIKPEVLQKLDSPPKKGSPLGLKKKSSNSEPEHDFNLEVVNLDNYGSPSKKRSSSKSRKRASAKPSGSSQSRKVGTGVSFGKLAEALEKQAKQDAKQGVAFKPAPFSP